MINSHSAKQTALRLWVLPPFLLANVLWTKEIPVWKVLLPKTGEPQRNLGLQTCRLDESHKERMPTFPCSTVWSMVKPHFHCNTKEIEERVTTKTKTCFRVHEDQWQLLSKTATCFLRYIICLNVSVPKRWVPGWDPQSGSECWKPEATKGWLLGLHALPLPTATQLVVPNWKYPRTFLFITSIWIALRILR